MGLAVVALALSGALSANADDRPLATVGGDPVTVSEWRVEFEGDEDPALQGFKYAGKEKLRRQMYPQVAEHRRRALDFLVERRLLSKGALDHDPSLAARADSVRIITARVRVCSGGSTSRMMLGGRHGASVAKSVRPTPRDEQKRCQSLKMVFTSA